MYFICTKINVMGNIKDKIKRKVKKVAKIFIKKKPDGDTSLNPMFPKAGITKDPSRRYKNGGYTKHK